MSNKQITLKSFEVEHKCERNHKERTVRWFYQVRATFSHGRNRFSIDLPEDLGDAIVAVCRGKIAEASAEAIEGLRLLATEATDDNQ